MHPAHVQRALGEALHRQMRRCSSSSAASGVSGAGWGLRRFRMRAIRSPPLPVRRCPGSAVGFHRRYDYDAAAVLLLGPL